MITPMTDNEILEILIKQLAITSDKERERFLSPDYDLHTHPPFLMNDMNEAVERVLDAIEKNEKIAVYSDFDADGIPAGAILYDLFKKLEFNNFINYIPHRNLEGYGFHKDAVSKLKEQDVSLIITVDVGISDYKTVEFAKNLDIDCIITDHHEPNGDFEKLKKSAVAILNPKREDSTYPFRELCGAGVAFKFAQAILQRGKENDIARFKKIKNGWEKWLLDLVAIATVADMVPLIDENRVFVKWGLVVLRKSPRAGIRALCLKTRVKQSDITEDDIAFLIAPRINAASRMDNPEDAFLMLTIDNANKAEDIVSHLEKLNNKRKGMVASLTRELVKKFTLENNLPAVLVAGNPNWSPALVGLAASSLSDRFKRPVCIWGREGTGVLKGSCRSNGSVDIVKLLEQSKDVLLGFGGHSGAGGFSVSLENVDKLKDVFSLNYEKIKNEKNTIAPAFVEIEIERVDSSLLDAIQVLAPFGVGNPKPAFKISGEVNSFKHFGKDKNHIEIFLQNKKARIRVFAFFKTLDSFGKKIEVGNNISVLATIERSRWKRNFIEMRLIDFI